VTGQTESDGTDPPRPSTPTPERLLSRLDPDRAATAAPEARAGAADARAVPTPDQGEPRDRARSRLAAPSPAIHTRRYRWMIGIFGLALVAGISIYQFAANGVRAPGVAPGRRLHYFAAPLASTNLRGDPNLNPPCTLARHDPRALNVCLIVRSRPLVLSFFVIGSGPCERQVNALQRLSARFPAVQFAAVAVNAGHSATAALIRSRRWTIPVAYDDTGAVGALYGVVVCPMAELAYRGGIVNDRLIGDRWQSATALAPRVRSLLQRGAPAR
jgi:hypothetical protein